MPVNIKKRRGQMRIGKFILGLIIASVGAAQAAHAAEPTDAQKRKTATSRYYVDRKLEEKQPAVQAETGNYVVTYPNSAGGDTNHDGPGEINKRHVSDKLSGTATDNITVDSADIPTVGAVNTGLNGKQTKLSGTPGKLVTFDSSAGTVTETDVYDSTGAYDTTTKEALVRAAHVNSAVVNGFAALLTCASYEGTFNSTNDPTGDHCLTYRVNTLDSVYVPHN